VEGQISWHYFPHTTLFTLPSAERLILEQWKARQTPIVHTNDTNGLHSRAPGVQKGTGHAGKPEEIQIQFQS